MQQNTREWLIWRSRRLGGSDAPAVMGVSPWRTPFQLHEEKVAALAGEIDDEAANWAQQRGIDNEPRARAWYELHADCDMPAACVEHPLYKFMGASLDGHNVERRKIVEIKCPGKEDHDRAAKGEIPEKYLWQVVHNLACADALACDYVSFHPDSGTGHIVTFERNLKLEKKLIGAEDKFWNGVLNGTPPPLTEKDYAKVEEPELRSLFTQWKTAKVLADQYAAELEGLKNQIAMQAIHGRMAFDGVRFVKSLRKGSVDYDALFKSFGINPTDEQKESCRKKPSEVVSMSLE